MAINSHNDIAKAIYLNLKDKNQGEVKQAYQNVINFLSNKRLLNKSNQILSRVQEFIDQEHKILRVKIFTSKQLESKTKIEIENELKKKYSAREIIFQEFIDPDLIGGIRIEIGDEVWDLSIKNKIRKLQEHLIKSI